MNFEEEAEALAVASEASPGKEADFPAGDSPAPQCALGVPCAATRSYAETIAELPR